MEPALLSHALEVAGKLANEATDVITATAGQGGQATGDGSPFDWVTDTDRTLERHTRRVLTKEFPGVPVFGGTAQGTAEHGGQAGESEYRWVVDPVDGTVNCVAGMPWCAYSLALLDADGPVVGVVADPYRAQIYAAARGRGARANGEPVRLGRAELAGGIVCTEFTEAGSWPGMTTFVSCAVSARAGVRVLGSAALAVAGVALGYAAATVLPSYREADVAGALALAVEAGATVTDRRGDWPERPADGLLVAAPAVAGPVLGWWQRCAG